MYYFIVYKYEIKLYVFFPILVPIGKEYSTLFMVTVFLEFRRSNMHPRGQFFSFWGSVLDLLDMYCSHCVSNPFSACSQSSQSVPQHVLNSTSLCPICLAQYCPLETYVRGQYWDLYNFMFEVNTSSLGSLQSFRICLWWANQRGSWSQEKKVLSLKGTFN